MKSRISMITLGVDDLPHAIRFYEQGLGFPRDAVLAQAAAAGAVITKPAVKTPWGGYAGYFADPEGYLWEVAHNPFFWVGPKDETL